MKKLFVILFALIFSSLQVQANNPISPKGIFFDIQSIKSAEQRSNKVKKEWNLKAGTSAVKLLVLKKLNKLAITAASCSLISLVLILFFFIGINTSVYLAIALSFAGIILGMYVLVKMLKADTPNRKERKRAKILAWFAILGPLVFMILNIVLNRPVM